MKMRDPLTMAAIAEAQFVRDLIRRFHLTAEQVRESEVYQRAFAIFVRRRWEEHA